MRDKKMTDRDRQAASHKRGLNMIWTAAEKYDLTDSMIVRAEWTEEREEPVNYGNGFHKRYYLCGKQKGESIWRIFEFGVM